MRIDNFDGTDPIRIFNFLNESRTECILNGMHVSYPTYVLPYFLIGSPQDNVNNMLAPRPRSTIDRTDAPPRVARTRQIPPDSRRARKDSSLFG